MRSDTVLFISAGMLRPKKRDHPLARRQLYLNYGALALATQVTQHGRRAVLAHGAHESPSAFVRSLVANGLMPNSHPIMLSMPSFYALEWAQEFCREVRIVDPGAQIIVGGRWVTTPDPDWLRKKLPEVNQVVTGLGEDKIGRLLDITMPSHATAGLPNAPLNHRLVSDFETFQPSIEASRGCGMGCAFCEERDIKLTKLRTAATIAADMVDIVGQYGGQDVHPYLQSSYFLPTARWAQELRKCRAEHGQVLAWRTETRVDSMLSETVEHLAAAGLRVIDLGLETASPRQILAMNKSRDPERYLRSASNLLRAFEANGVWAKVNILMYAGETTETFDETRAWLDEHASAIKGVSVGPVVVYGPPKQADPLLEELSRYGARPVDSTRTDHEGITMLHPSPSMDAETAEAACLDLSRRHMTADDYFDLKSFSYYPRGYCRADFDADVCASDPAHLPFDMGAPNVGAARPK